MVYSQPHVGVRYTHDLHCQQIPLIISIISLSMYFNQCLVTMQPLMSMFFMYLCVYVCLPSYPSVCVDPCVSYVLYILYFCVSLSVCVDCRVYNVYLHACMLYMHACVCSLVL